MMTVGSITQLTTDKGLLPKQIAAVPFVRSDPANAALKQQALPPVRTEPLLAVYDRFAHLDRVFEMVGDSDGTENTDPFHPAARDMWRAIKASLGISTNNSITGGEAVPSNGVVGGTE